MSKETAGSRPAASPPSVRPQLSLEEAARYTGVSSESLRAAIDDGRLRARFGRQTPVRGAGRKGNPWRWIIELADLMAFVDALPQCRYPGCDRPGPGPTGCCSGPHAQGVRMRGVPRPDISAKVSAALRGKQRGPHTPHHRARIKAGLRRFYDDRDASARTRATFATNLRDPKRQLAAQMVRWGRQNVEAAKRAAARFEAAVRSSRGGRPRTVELHRRWLAMFEGGDLELEDLVRGERMSRARAIALLDWQRHPDDWPRDKWPASRSDPDDIEPRLLAAAKARVEKALQRARTKPLVR